MAVDPTKVEPYASDAVKEKFPPGQWCFRNDRADGCNIKLANEYLFPVTAWRRRCYTGGAPVDGGT